jgi:hypothetical protein
MSDASPRPRDSGEVIIAVDPHKASWTAVVVNGGLLAVAAIRVEVNRAGCRQLQRFAASWPQARWAVEGAAGLGAPLTQAVACGWDRGDRRASQARSPGAVAVHRPRP